VKIDCGLVSAGKVDSPGRDLGRLAGWKRFAFFAVGRSVFAHVGRQSSFIWGRNDLGKEGSSPAQDACLQDSGGEVLDGVREY